MAEDKEKTLAFIEDYRTCRILWDQTNIDYTNKKKRYGALTALGQKHNLDVQMVKNKIKSLRSYFSKEHLKVIKCAGEMPGENYQSAWFAYKSLLFILDSTPKEAGEITYANSTASQDETKKYVALVSGNMADGEQELVLPTHRSKRIKTEDDREDEACTATTNAEPSNNDECTAFGQLVAHKLRKLTPRNKLLAQRRICNMFFDLELEEIDRADNTVYLSELALN